MLLRNSLLLDAAKAGCYLPVDHRFALGEREGRIHQRKVTERLREVAELSLVCRVVFFGE